MAAGGIKPQGEDNSSLDRWQPGRYEKGEPNGWRGRRPDALADHLTGFPSVGMPNHRSRCGFASTELAVLRTLIEGGRMTRSTEFRFMVKDPLIRSLLEVRVDNRTVLTAEVNIWRARRKMRTRNGPILLDR